MSLLPVVVGLAAAALWGSSDYLGGLAARSMGEYAANAYVFLFGATTILIAVLLTGTGTTANVTEMLLGAVLSVPIFLGALFTYKAFRIGEFAVNAPIVDAYPIVIVLGFVFILGHSLSNLEMVGVAMTVLGVILIATRFSRLKLRKKFLAAGVGSAAASMILVGAIPSIFAAVYASIIGFLLLSLMWRGLPALIAFVAGYATGQNLHVPSRNVLSLVVVAGIMDGLALSVYLYGIFANSLALPVIATLSGLTGAVTVAYGLVLSRERPEANQWIGIALAITGTAILSYLSSL